MDIRKLEKITGNPVLYWGSAGYSTDTVFTVSVIETADAFEFSLREKHQPYTRERTLDDAEISRLNELMKHGHSFGAFHEEELIGWAVCRKRERNASLVIEHLLISKPFRRQDIGKLLIKAVSREARALSCRLVEVETQNTNYPAICFFRKCGFRFTGINTERYAGSAETALLMSFDVMI